MGAALRPGRCLARVRPGYGVAYSNANYLVLGLLVERASGSDFGAYVAEHVFEPVGMTHAHADLPDAKADGLTDAHRFWFGIPQAGEPLWRPDLVPAGWLISSAEDLGRRPRPTSMAGGSADARSCPAPGSSRCTSAR